MKLQSVMHDFSRLPRAEAPRSRFDLSHGYKTTFDSGKLIPFFVQEVLPGDTIVNDSTLFARLTTPKVPFMDNLFLDTFFFFVPHRLVWEHWRNFMGEKVNPGDSTEYTIPQMPCPAGGWLVGSLGDYLGLPTEVDSISVSALPFRGYNLIYNHWFRSQKLIDSLTVDLGDADSDPADYVVQTSTKRPDYFTSCLPSPQEGDPIDIPLGTVAPVVSSGENIVLTSNQESATNALLQIRNSSVAHERMGLDDNPGTDVYSARWAQTGMEADLSDATAATVSSLREAFQLQRMAERDMRHGSRYVEILHAHFSVVNPDLSFRPEYLGGGSTPVQLNPIAQTSEAGTTPQGTLAAIGTALAQGHGFTKSFVEHGYCFGICRVRADLTYQSGIDRHWSRLSKFDFFWPSLQHLGEQSVLNKEIFAQGTSADDAVFGYQERYGEYKYGMSKITGALRSSYATSLDVWHLSQEFADLPVLGEEFIQEDVPLSRVVAVPSEPEFRLDVFSRLYATRVMSVYGIPGLIDHM